MTSKTTPPETDQVQSLTDAPMSGAAVQKPWYRRRRWWLPAALVLPVIAAGFWFGTQFNEGKIAGKAVNLVLVKPDAWIHSQNLSQLPRDMLTVPLVKDVLTEDFLYFYDTDEDWLSLKGTMRRISFEHELNWRDDLFANMAQAPADIYLWRDGSSALGYWAIGVQRTGLTSVAQNLAQIKLNVDRQLTQIGTVSVDGDDVPLLQVKLSPRRTMVMAVHGEHMALVSDVAMLNDGKGNLSDDGADLLTRLLTDDADKHLEIAQDLVTPDDAKGFGNQSIALSSRFLAQGYGAIMPHVQGLRFDYDGKAWRSQIKLNEDAPALNPEVWQHVPSNAAWCVATTIDWARVQKSLDASKSLTNAPKLATLFEPTGAACWYADESSSVTKPLFVGRLLQQPAEQSVAVSAQMNQLFNWAISTNKDYLSDVRKAARDVRRMQNELNALTLEQSKLKKDAASFDKKEWQKRLESAKNELADYQKQSDEDIAHADKEQLETLKNSQKENLGYYNQNIQSIEDEPDEYKKRYQELLTQNAKAQSYANDKLAALTKILKTEQTTAQGNAAPALALDVQTVGGLSLMSRKMPIQSKTNPLLAYANNGTVYFSLDEKLVQRGMAVHAKSYPNLAEAVPMLGVAAQAPYFYFNPTKASVLFTQEGHKTLPQKSKATLRTAFDYHMPARMAALAQNPQMAATIDAHGGSGWLPLNWQH